MLRKRSAIDFQFGDCIGEGSYSKVFKAISIHNRKTYAIKILSKTHIQRENKRKYVNIEKDTLNILGRHPGIVTLYYTFQDDQSLYFVIDFAQKGELLSLIRKLGSLSESLTKYYMTQLIDAVEFIHSKGIIHRDLKPENILLNHEWKLMITDFGAAKILTNDEIATNAALEATVTRSNGDSLHKQQTGNSSSSSMKKTKSNDDKSINANNTGGSTSSGSTSTHGTHTRTGSFVGTAEYVSPELLKYNLCGFESDLWAIGCILYQLIVGRPPFKGQTEYMTFEKIISLDYEFPKNYFIPDRIISLVKQLLVLRPENRLDIDGLKEDIWFNGIDWNDKNLIWKRKVPKLEAYNPRLYQTTLANNLNSNNSNTSLNSYGSKPISYHYVDPNGKLTSKTSSIPQSVLSNQIKNSQNNPYIINKVLNNRLEEKNKEVRETTLKTNQMMSAATKAANLSSKIIQPTPTSNNQAPLLMNNADIVRRRNSLQFASSTAVSDTSLNESITPPDSRASSPSLSSLKTSGTSKSVIKRSNEIKTPPTSGTQEKAPQLSSSNSSNIVTSSPKLVVNKKQPKRMSSTSSINQSSPTQSSNAKYPQSSTTANRAPSISEMLGLPQPSSAAVSAAGAIGNMMNHNRTMKSSNGISSRQLYNQQQQQQIINPILLDKTIPKDITNKLMANEYILKLDNIFKSELAHKTNNGSNSQPNGSSAAQNTSMALDDLLLNKIITENYQKLNRDLKSCILIITSMARLLIFELNSSFTLQDPQSSTRLQAMDFYSNITEIRLTNKNVSMYDYEFDEDTKEGYLILELVNLNKLIFLSAYNHKTLVRGSINSNVRVGFTVNENITWIDSLLKAKELLRQNSTKNNQNTQQKQQSDQQQQLQKRNSQTNTAQASAFAAAAAAASSAAPPMRKAKSDSSRSEQSSQSTVRKSTVGSTAIPRPQSTTNSAGKNANVIKKKASSTISGITNGTKGLSLNSNSKESLKY